MRFKNYRPSLVTLYNREGHSLLKEPSRTYLKSLELSSKLHLSEICLT